MKLYKYIKQIHSYQIIAVGSYLKVSKLRYPLSQRQLNDIINVSRDSIEIKGDTITSLCEVDTLIGVKDGGRLHLLIVNRDFPLVIYKYRTQ